MTTPPDLTRTQTTALRDYVRARGHMWKSDLHHAWCSPEGRRSVGVTLAALESSHGFAWLHAFETPGDWYQDVGESIAAARPEVPAGPRKRFALVPAMREEICDHPLGFRYTGAIPCTGPRVCPLCGEIGGGS
jgi:hypothetical protein